MFVPCTEWLFAAKKQRAMWNRRDYSTLEPKDVLWLTGQDYRGKCQDSRVLLADVHFYDQRGGGIEIEIDVLHLNGFVVFDQRLHLLQLSINPADPLDKELAIGLAALLAREHVAVYSGEI